MIRSSLVRTTRRVSLRANSTSAQKRALNQQQLQGRADKPPQKPDPPASDGSSPPPPPPPPTSTSIDSPSMTPFIVAGVIVAGLVGANQFGLLPMPGKKKDEVAPVAMPQQPTSDESVEKPAEEEPVPVVEEKPTEEVVAIEVETVQEDTKQTEDPVVEKVEEEKEEEEAVAVAQEIEEEPIPVEKVPEAETVTIVEAKGEPTVEEAIQELRVDSFEKESRTLEEAHRSLRANLDESLLQDLDTLTPAQLKVRVVQLAAEMNERTKWEAVRLKEFLAMKERETAEKYMELMQKQRLELEAILAQRVREQEDALTRQANAALQQKDASVEQLIKAATEAQEAEHEAQLASAKQRLEKQIGAKYEKDYGEKLAKAKEDFAKELKSKLATLQGLAQKVRNLESALSVSRSFESGSLAAHRVSAAALALAEKLETSQSAAIELRALQSAAEENTVISSAISNIPSTAAKGVPTVSELQTKFEAIHSKARQAALVPEGRPGLEGQLLGMVFSTIKYAPNPDGPFPEGSTDDAEYILARARKHVQLGELEQAVEQMDKLKGQTALTMRDWNKAAKDRVAINKALHVIKLESAMMNESMMNAAK